MDVKEQNSDGVVILTLSGELTIYTAAETKRKLFSYWDKELEVELDLSEVTEIDGAGMQILMQLKHEAVECRKPICYTNHSQPVLDVMELLKLTSKFADPVVLSAKAEGRSC